MALKPATPIEPYEDLLPELDMLLVMTVEPGFGGQTFLDVCLPKIRRARELIDKHGARPVAAGRRRGRRWRRSSAAPRPGADVFVAGSAVFGADDPAAMIEALRTTAAAAVDASPWDRSRTGARGDVARLVPRVNSSRAPGSV